MLRIVVFAVLASAATAHAEPQVWDSRGWFMLGERTVTGAYDRDTISVGRYEGSFAKLNVVVLDSELEVFDVKITFADNSTYLPKVEHAFKDGARTRAIDLPASDKLIRSIELRYRNVPAGRRARVQVFGWKVGDVPPPLWDSTGWTMLGERVVDGSDDRATIAVARVDGTFTKLTVVVLDSDLELVDLTVKLARGAPWHPQLAHAFREGARTRAIDFPGDDRAITSVDLRYRNLPAGGRARVQVWGLRGETPRPTAPPPPGTAATTWDSTGWTLLGERVVNGKADRDAIAVRTYQGTFTRLTVVVADSDLELLGLAVKFARGPAWRPAVAHYFRDGQRTRAIDFPGDERTIKQIDLRYRNVPGGGRARVQVWGQPSGWDSKGWTLLGERAVDGRVDHDRIAVGRGGTFKKATIVVLDSDLDLVDFAVGFGKGAPYHPELKALFREGTRTRALDLPGDKRVIRYIDFTYRNLAGGGRARVQVWAK
jgi:hypothetical protein